MTFAWLFAVNHCALAGDAAGLHPASNPSVKAHPCCDAKPVPSPDTPASKRLECCAVKDAALNARMPDLSNTFLHFVVYHCVAVLPSDGLAQNIPATCDTGPPALLSITLVLRSNPENAPPFLI